MAKLIELDGVSKVYPMPGGDVQALRNVSLSFEEGEFAAVVGSSGSGKSTLLYLLGLLISPTRGSYRFGGRSMEALPDRERAGIRGKQIGFIFQSFHLIPQLTVLKNVLLGTRYGTNSNNANLTVRAHELLDRVGLSHRLHHRPGELSNGEMQRVAIARALLGSPRLILADEPTGNLDETTGGEIFELLESLNKDGKTVILVTHNLRLAKRTPKTITLRDGEVAP
ncbi:MAG: ABC transporter ATP-binding protein [Planctomycetota bacterium]